MSDETDDKNNVVEFSRAHIVEPFPGKLLISESPLQVLPSLAAKVGLNEALVLQQMHYWISNPLNKNFKNGRTWVYNTYDEWKKQFPFWCLNTIIRTISSLESKKLIISGAYNKLARDRTKWYAIDYNALMCLEIGTFTQNEQMHLPKMSRSIYPKWVDVLPETTTEISTDIKKINKKDFDIEFGEFWEQYPKKVDKHKAADVYKKLLAKDYGLHAIVISALCAQNEQRAIKTELGIWQPEPKGPAAWLNAERWDDEIKTREQLNEEHRPSKQVTSGKPSKSEQYLNALDAYERKLQQQASEEWLRENGQQPEGDESI